MKLVITSSTLPCSESDEVPAFVRDQAIELKRNYPQLDIVMHAPHNSYSDTASVSEDNEFYRVCRFHYFWPFKWELLVGRGIMPALRQNKLLYAQIPFLILFQFLSLLILVRKEKPSLIYAHWFTPQAISSALVARLTRTPFIFTTHASDVAVLNKLPFANKIVAWVCRKAFAYTAVSQRTADKLKAFFSEQEWESQFSQKLSVIPMGVTTQLSELPDKALNDVKAQLNILENKPCVLFLGRLAEKKGVSYLLDALAKLSLAQRNEFQLVIAGDGQLKAQLQAQCAELKLDNVTFAGYVTGARKDALIASADYACFPSIVDDSGDAEGFPVSIMECLAAGKLLLSSNVTGAEDVLLDNDAGLVFEEKSASEIAQALIEIFCLSEPKRKQMRENARRLAAQYDWQRVSQQHHDIFYKCLNDDF